MTTGRINQVCTSPNSRRRESGRNPNSRSREPKANVSGLAGDCLLWQSNRLSLQRWLAHIRGDRVTSPHGQYIYCLNFWSWTLLRTCCNCSYRDSSTLICCWHELMINYCGTVVCMAKFHNSLSPG